MKKRVVKLDASSGCGRGSSSVESSTGMQSYASSNR